MINVMEKNHTTTDPIHSDERNPGLPFNTKYFDAININKSAIDRRVSTLTGRRSVKKEFQAAWLLSLIHI